MRFVPLVLFPARNQIRESVSFFVLIVDILVPPMP